MKFWKKKKISKGFTEQRAKNHTKANDWSVDFSGSNLNMQRDSVAQCNITWKFHWQYDKSTKNFP